MNARHQAAAAAVVVTVAMLGGCGPNLRALDRQLDFGDTFVGTPVTRSTAWVNHGGEAHIGEVRLSRSDAFTLDASAIERDPELSENERSGDVVVTFEPPEAGVFEGRLSLDSNGSEEDVSLRGRGVYTLSASAVSLSGSGLQWDEPLDHGSVPVAGGESVRRLRVTNRTDEAVVITPTWARGQQGFSLRGDVDAIRLAPGLSVELTTRFDPESSGTFQDTLMLVVDDADTRGGVVVTGSGTR